MVGSGHAAPGSDAMVHAPVHFHDDVLDAPAVIAVPSAAIRLVVVALGWVRPLVVVLVLAVVLAGCGRKGGLEAPGLTDDITGTEAQLAVSRGLTRRARLGNTVVDAPRAAPPLRRTRGEAEANLRAADVRGANADAPETGDAIPEGPTVGTPPRRRFVLDPLL